MDQNIIPQYYQQYNSFPEYSNEKATEIPFYRNHEKIDAKDILDFDQLFIIAEPGFGKTTLIKQVINCLEEQKISFHYHNGIDSNDEKKIIKAGISYYIFDALDENRDVIATFIEVLSYCKTNNIKLIISNRTHYISTIEHLLLEESFKFIRLLAFEEHQIFSFLRSNLKEPEYSDDDIESIIHNSKANSRTSILRVPRYLNEFCQYINHHKLTPSQIKQLSKSQLFEKVIYFKLETEDKENKENVNQKYLTKRVLERLSLVMEIHELNQISKEDFITFLDQTDSNISLIFLNSINLDVLLQRVMKPTEEMLSFEHSEFQEYMAAKELTRLGYRFQTIYDLMIEPELQLLRPNWIDVLSFAVDMEPEFVRPIITFISTRGHENVDEKLIEILINVPHTCFDTEFKDYFFETIFKYYTIKGKMIYNINGQLSSYITDSNISIYNPFYHPENLTDAVRHIQGNQILLIEALAKADRLNDEQKLKWNDYLLKLIVRDELYGMHNTFFFALIAIGIPEPLLALVDVFEQKQDYLLNNYLTAVSKIAPDDERLVALISRSILQNRNLNNLDSAIDRLTSANGIISIFNTLSNITDTLRNDSFRFGEGFYWLFATIEEIDSKKVDTAIKNFLLKALNEDRYAQYLPNICDRSLAYLVKKNQNFIKKIMPLKTFLNSVDEIVKSIIRIIDLKTFKLIEDFLISQSHQWRLDRVVQKVKYELEKTPENPIYAYIDQKYLKVWAQRAITYEVTHETTNIEKLREYYLDGDEYFNPPMIPLLVNKFDELEPLLTDLDRAELKKVITIILNNYKPDEFRIEIFDIKNNQTSFNHNHDTWFHIELYFKAAYLLGAKDLLKQFREKLLKTLPRLDIFEHQRKNMMQNLINSIGPITPLDVQTIYDYCNGRTDDMLALSSRSFAEVARALKLHQLNPVLLKLVNNEKVKSFEKEDTLFAFGELAKGEKDKASLNEIFNRENQSSKIKDIANAALISQYRDKKAILWRFHELKTRMRPLDTDHKYNGARGVSSFESEMDRPEFPNCLYGIEDKTIYEQMLNLLTYSFSIRNDKLQFRYSVYLQQIVYTYFKTFVTVKIISDLRKTSASFEIIEQTYSFNLQLDSLVTDLHQRKKNPEPFITAIQGLNHILSRVYLPIYSNEELTELVLKVINNEIKNLIENEGFYRLSDELKAKKDSASIKVGETIIQKTLKIALEKALLENGLRKADVHREVESLGGLKYDFLINYGLYGPVMVEIKLLNNPEIQTPSLRKKYKEKLSKYLGANNGQGIYLIFQIHNSPKHLEQYNKMVIEYKDLKSLEIPLIQCYDDEFIAKTKRKLISPKVPLKKKV